MTNISTNTQKKQIQADDLADFLLDVGVLLLASGAHSGRVWRNCQRIAQHWNFQMNMNPTFTGIFFSIWEENHRKNSITHFKSVPAHTVHLNILTLVSHLSWDIYNDKFNFDEARNELEKIKQKQNYNYGIVAMAVGVSCGSLCAISGGDMLDSTFAFLAAAIGSVARVGIIKFRFNQFLSFIIAAFITTIIAGFDTFFHLGVAPEVALAVAVLYLIPGVPLTNSVIDLIEGFFNTALARAVYALSIITSIAVGMTLGIMLLGLNNF